MIDQRYLFVVETMMLMDGHRITALKPNKDGYYTVPLMVLEAENLIGITYSADSMMRCITEPTSRFNLLLTDGKAFGEMDHPFGKGTKEDIPRMLEIMQKSTSHHIRKVWTHPMPLENGGILLMGEVKPYGPYGDQLRQSLEDPHINTSFSVRSLCTEKNHPSTGKRRRDVSVLITFDAVSGGGFKQACKRMVPGMESFEIAPHDFLNRTTDTRVALESNTISDSEFISLFGTKAIQFISSTTDVTGLYNPGSSIFTDSKGNKKSLLHQALKR